MRRDRSNWFGMMRRLGLEPLVLEFQEVVLAEDLPVVPGHPLGGLEVPGEEPGLHFPPQAGREGDEPLAVLPEELLVHSGLVVEPLGEARGDQLGQVGEALRVLRQEHQVVAGVPVPGGVQAVLHPLGVGRRVVQLAVEPGAGGHVDLAAQDGLDGPGAVLVLGLLAGVEELHHPEHVPVVSHGHRGHARGLALLDEVGDPREAVEQGILGVEMEVGEAHGGIVPTSAPAVGSAFPAAVPGNPAGARKTQS